MHKYTDSSSTQHTSQFINQKILHKISPANFRFLKIWPSYDNSQFSTFSLILRVSRVLILKTLRGNTGCMFLYTPLGTWYALSKCGSCNQNCTADYKTLAPYSASWCPFSPLSIKMITEAAAVRFKCLIKQKCLEQSWHTIIAQYVLVLQSCVNDGDMLWERRC